MDGLLFIDDEEGVRRSVIRALKREPYPTWTAEDGRSGIAFFRENMEQVGTVVSDYKMPEMDGLETLSKIGALNPEITRVILTGYATMEAAIAATNEGIDGFLTKPFDNIELRAQIHGINVRKRLRQFISEQIYREIAHSPKALMPRFQEVSILFSDIRGFTAMSQTVSPETLADFLNHHYFTPMGEIVHRFNGTVDKHIGDSIMVVHGSPAAEKDDTIRAVTAAVEMQRKAAEIDRGLRGRDGLQLEIGIGISTGRVFSGVLGSRRRKEFTSVGMPVNIAARLQSLAAPGEILIGRRTFEKVSGHVRARRMPPVQAKGVRGPITVFSVSY
jgi:adenylate cyclase